MKKNIFFAWFIAAVLFVNGCKKDRLVDDCISNAIPTDSYAYPILPGTPAWANLQTGAERLQACQIPDNILLGVSTEGLIQSWLDMPINNEILMTNSLQKGIVYFIANFSGLKELVKRNDVADKLVKKYYSMNPACVTTYQTDIEKGKFIYSFSCIELPLAQDTILNRMTTEQKKVLIKKAMDKYYSRKEYSNYYDLVSTDLSLFICAKAMKNSQYQPFLNQINNNLQWFLENAQFYIPLGDYTTEKNIIISQALNFIK